MKFRAFYYSLLPKKKLQKKMDDYVKNMDSLQPKERIDLGLDLMKGIALRARRENDKKLLEYIQLTAEIAIIKNLVRTKETNNK